MSSIKFTVCQSRRLISVKLHIYAQTSLYKFESTVEIICIFLEHQNLSSSSLKAKNEMLATLSLSTWSEKVSSKRSEVSRVRSCHTGFGMVALKNREGLLMLLQL